MKSNEIEIWARQVIHRIETGGQHEDSRVELKRLWPEPYKAVRQLAGHANAALGDPILWLIGVGPSGVCGVDNREIGDWYNQVRSHFDNVAPTLLGHPSFEHNGLSVVPLVFSTERPPYVIRDQKSRDGVFAYGVPWREGTNIRAARRDDLLLLLVEQQRLPHLEVLAGSVTAWLRPNETEWVLELSIYITYSGPRPVVVPFHLSTVTIRPPGRAATIDPPKVSFGPSWSGRQHPPPPSPAIQVSSSELVISGSGQIRAWARTVGPLHDERSEGPCVVTLEVVPAGARMSVKSETRLESTAPPLAGATKQVWVFSRTPWLSA